jgi:signal transduction histidine kinase/CheY-like chemotaxis protein
VGPYHEQTGCQRAAFSAARVGYGKGFAREAPWQVVGSVPAELEVIMTPSEPAWTDQRILVLAPGPEDAALIRTVADTARLPNHACADIGELCREFAAGAGALLVAEEMLDPPALRRLVEALGRQPPWSDVPVVTLFGAVEGGPDVGLRMLDLLEPLGNVTVLERPASAVTLASALRAALRARRRQYQVRDLSAKQERSLRQRERFLTLLAHELRDPLGAVRHATQVLDRVGSQASLAVEQRAVIVRQTSRMAHLIEDMLDVYRVLAGKVAVPRVPVDLRRVAALCLQALAGEFEAMRQRVTFSAGAGPLTVEGDAQRLGQVITHLLTNASRHTPQGGRIDLSLERDDGEAVVRVRDTGVGLPPDKLPHLFEQFAEAEAEADLENQPEARLKMGLTLVHRLVELHDGRVSAWSRGPGKGSEFIVRLPLKAAEAVPVPSAAPEEPARAAPRRVLVIEDNADGREMLRRMLQLWGHEVEVAADGVQGVRQALEHVPEVALVDIGLPGLDGYGVAHELRSALGRRIYLAAMTGYGPPHDQQRALEAGFDTLFVKPVAPQLLSKWLAAPTSAARREEPVPS